VDLLSPFDCTGACAGYCSLLYHVFIEMSKAVETAQIAHAVHGRLDRLLDPNDGEPERDDRRKPHEDRGDDPDLFCVGIVGFYIFHARPVAYRQKADDGKHDAERIDPDLRAERFRERGFAKRLAAVRTIIILRLDRKMALRADHRGNRDGGGGLHRRNRNVVHLYIIP